MPPELLSKRLLPKRPLPLPLRIALAAALAAVVLVPSALALHLAREKSLLTRQKSQLTDRADRLGEQVSELEHQLSDLQQRYDAVLSPTGPEHPDYESLYPDLYIPGTPAGEVRRGTAFLTFDDGPSPRTDDILAILREENVKATFFVVGPDTLARRERLQRIAAEGHAIGVHSASHDYHKIYASVEDYLADFYEAYTMVKEATGTAPSIFRFPGGSINSYNRGIYQEIIAEMLRRGFVYYDWNVSSGDAVSRPLPVATLRDNVLTGSARQSRPIILMHDSSPRTTTVQALPEIIAGLREQGFSLDSLNRDDLPVSFGYPTPAPET